MKTQSAAILLDVKLLVTPKVHPMFCWEQRVQIQMKPSSQATPITWSTAAHRERKTQQAEPTSLS